MADTQTPTSESGTMQQVGDQVRNVASSAQNQVRDVASTAQDQAQAVAGKAGGRVQEQIRNATGQLGEQVHDAANNLRTVAGELRRIDKSQPAEVAERISQPLDRVAEYLMRSDPSRLLRDAENLGRRQPWAVLAGAATLGFIASRVLKASSATRYAQGSNVSVRSTSELRSQLDAPPASSISPDLTGV